MHMTSKPRYTVTGWTRPLSLVYFEPTSGKKKAKSAGTRDWREAERVGPANCKRNWKPGACPAV